MEFRRKLLLVDWSLEIVGGTFISLLIDEPGDDGVDGGEFDLNICPISLASTY